MDPQHRLLLEAGYMATHGAGQRRGELLRRDVGIFVGIMNTDFASIAGSESAYAATGIQVSIASGRLAFALGTQGPCASIDTACSSALVALDNAVSSLRACDIALATAAKEPPSFLFRDRRRQISGADRKNAPATRDSRAR